MPIFQQSFASLTIIRDLPQFRLNSVKIAAKNDGFERKFSNMFAKITQNISKINGAKDCKFEFGAVQRNANLIKSCRSRKILKNASFLAIVAVHTAENEPSEIYGSGSCVPPPS